MIFPELYIPIDNHRLVFSEMLPPLLLVDLPRPFIHGLDVALNFQKLEVMGVVFRKNRFLERLHFLLVVNELYCYLNVVLDVVSAFYWVALWAQ